jgi:hypothetical protein
LDAPLRPQPRFRLAGFFPQLINGLEVPSILARLGDAAVPINKVLTPRGQVSRRALPWRYGPYNFRAQWGLNEITRLICVGNCPDRTLERLWRAEGRARDRSDSIWMKIRVLGFDFATSLNFSIYLDDPRMEHLINIRRTWLTVAQMQRTSTLIPIPHLQWATLPDLQRQLEYARDQGFHTLTINLQMVRSETWEVFAGGLPLIRELPNLRLLFTGAAGLRRIRRLVRVLPDPTRLAFTSATPHYLAERYTRLDRDGVRLIKEPVEGHPDLILAENVRLYRDFLGSLNGHGQQAPAHPESTEESTMTMLDESQGHSFGITADLQARFGYESGAAQEAAHLLAVDEAILEAVQTWLHTGQLDRNFRGSFPSWPCAECVPHPTLGQLLDSGADPLDAFLHLAHLAQQVDEEIEVYVGRAGY